MFFTILHKVFGRLIKDYVYVNMIALQIPVPRTNNKLEPTDTGGGGGAGGAEESNRSPVQVDVHRGADNQLLSSLKSVRHVQTTSEENAGATTLNVVNDDDDDEKENEEDRTVSGTATVSFEMKAAGKPRKSSSLKRSESGGVRPKEKLHGASLS